MSLMGDQSLMSCSERAGGKGILLEISHSLVDCSGYSGADGWRGRSGENTLSFPQRCITFTDYSQNTPVKEKGITVLVGNPQSIWMCYRTSTRNQALGTSSDGHCSHKLVGECG